MKSKYFFAFIISFILLISSHTVLAQEKTDTTDENTELDTLLGKAIEGNDKYEFGLKNSYNSMRIISADEIERLGLTSFLDLIQISSNFYVSNDGTWTYGGARGLNFHTSCGTRTPLTINGVQLVDYSFGSALNSNMVGIPLEFVERVELINGPPSSIYGSNAMFGAINIITKKGKDIDGTMVFGGIDSEGKTNASLIFGNKYENGLDVLFAYKMNYWGGNNMYFREYDDTDSEYGNPESPLYNPRATNKGIAEKRNNYMSNMLFLSVKYDDLSFLGMHSISNRTYPDAPFEGIFNDPDAKMNVVFSTATLSYDIKCEAIGIHTLTPQMFYSYSQSELRYNYLEDKETDDNGNVIAQTILNQMEKPLFSSIGIGISDVWEITYSDIFTLGFKYTHSIQNDVQFLDGYGNLDNIISGALQPLRIFEVFGEYSHDFNDWLVGFAGLKYERSQHNNDALLPRLGLILSLDDNSIIKLLYGTASRMPSSYEEYTNTIWLPKEDGTEGTTAVLDTKLNYEHATSFELMYIYHKKNISGNASLFYNIFSDLAYLDWYPASKDPYYLFHYINTNSDIKIHNYGISARISYKTDFGLHIEIGNTYNLVNKKNITEQNYYLNEAIECNSPRNIMIYLLSYNIFDFYNINLFGSYETSRKSFNPLTDKFDKETGELLHREFVDLKPVFNMNVSITYNPLYIGDKYKFINRFNFTLYFNNVLNTSNYYPVPSLLGILGKYPRDDFNVGLRVGIKL